MWAEVRNGGVREEFELDVEGTAEVGLMARGAARVLGCGEEGRARDVQQRLGGGMSECVYVFSVMGTG